MNQTEKSNEDETKSNNMLPMIEKSSRKIDSSGTIFEEKHISIRGKSLDECRKHYEDLK